MSYSLDQKNSTFENRPSKGRSGTSGLNFCLGLTGVKSSWKMTGFKKFAHFGQSSDPDVSSQDIENELNEQLELACSITEA